MTKTLTAIAVLVACAQTVAAHQLDEYLQAARIAIELERIVLELNLTPGVAVASQIFATIDRNGDIRVSPSEIEAYGRQVLLDLALDVDGMSMPLTLVGAESPAWPEMRDGVGTIRLTAAADARLRPGRHQLHFVNNHRSDISVYLLNALMPASSAIVIREQERDVLQHGIRLEFDRSTPYTSAAWILFPLFAAATLAFRFGGLR